MNARALILAAAAFLPAACTIGPDYERPDDMMPAEQYRGVITPQQAESFADLDWIQAFADPQLTRLIRIALDNNLDLMIAAQRVQEFRGQTRISNSTMGPQIRGTGGTSPSLLGDEDSSYSLGFSLSSSRRESRPSRSERFRSSRRRSSGISGTGESPSNSALW